MMAAGAAGAVSGSCRVAGGAAVPVGTAGLGDGDPVYDSGTACGGLAGRDMAAVRGRPSGGLRGRPSVGCNFHPVGDLLPTLRQ